MLKSLDKVGVLWLTCLNVAWRSGTVPLDQQTGMVVTKIKGGGQGVLSVKEPVEVV